MRRVHGADNPFNRPRVAASAVPASVRDAGEDARGSIARLFFDLRQALKMTPHGVAAQVMTTPDVIYALERGDFEMLPDRTETSRVVLAYTALANIDGRPVLTAIGPLISQSAQLLQPVYTPLAAPQSAAPLMLPAPAQSVSTARRVAAGPAASRRSMHAALPVGLLLNAGAVIAHSAARLPADAIRQVRQRPERAFYALSLPLALLLFALHSSILQTVISFVPRPAAEIVRDVKMYLEVQFAPVRDGLRWIDVDNPRDRRGDKLRRRGQSD